MSRKPTALRRNGRSTPSAGDPIERFEKCFAAAEAAQIALPEAVALATADKRGHASVRFVLLKQVDNRGFVFFTNLDSRKGRELKSNPHASFAVHWKAIGKQVRVEGHTVQVSDDEADAYWATRPRESQLGAVASRQSAPLASHEALTKRWMQLERRYRDRSVPRPAPWTGVRLIPSRIEFWEEEEHRLHRRDLFVRTKRGWRHSLLQP